MWLSGRAFALHVKGPGFDPRHLHNFLLLFSFIFTRFNLSQYVVYFLLNQDVKLTYRSFRDKLHLNLKSKLQM